MSSLVYSQFLFWLAAAICAAAQLTVVRAALAGRTPGASSGVVTRVRELFWVLLPAVALTLVLVWTWRALPTSPPRVQRQHAAPAVIGQVSLMPRHEITARS